MSSINPPPGGPLPLSQQARPSDAEAVPEPIADAEQDTPLPPRAPLLLSRSDGASPAAAAREQHPDRELSGGQASGRRGPIEAGTWHDLWPQQVELSKMQLLRIDEVLGDGSGEAPGDARTSGAGASSPIRGAGRGAAERRVQPAVFIAQPEVEGELSTLEPARLMGWAIATGFCGCLWLAPQGVMQPVGAPLDHPSSTPHRELYFERGVLLGAHSTLAGDGLVDVLAAGWSGRQTQRARSVVASAPPRNLREQLSRLCRARLLDAKDAAQRLHGYVVELVYRALAPTPGRYRLLPRALTAGERVTPPGSPRLLLVEGLRRRTSLELLQRHLGPPSVQLIPISFALAQEGGRVLRDIGLTPEEEVALHCFDGRTSLAEIMTRAELGEHATYVLAYALLCLGALAVPGALPLPRSGIIRPPAPEPPPARPATAANELSVAIARVQAKYAQVECADYFTLLEIPPTATALDVRRAHERLRPQFLPAAVPYRCRMAMERELRQIVLLLDEARVVLGNDELRTAYRAELR